MPIDDCERLVDGLLVQPVNALSSLMFVVVGITVAGIGWFGNRKRAPVGLVFGLVLILVGVGSFAFHGPAGALAGWAHDASITALLLLVIAVEIGDRLGLNGRMELTVWTVVAFALVGIEAAWPQIADPLNAPLALIAVVSVVGSRWGTGSVQPGRSKGVVVGMAILATGALLMVLGRTGWPLCDPDSLLQAHSVWHVLAAAGTGVYAVSVSASGSTHLTPSV